MSADEPSCPSFIGIGDGAENIDLMCWLLLDHEGPHMDPRGTDEQCVWWTTDQYLASVEL